uniref:Uncharacterized protein n=1 Tax=Panagrolaimus sp. PS1159 TaxID=55785 RepID=A0AC35FR97_9BILA
MVQRKEKKVSKADGQKEEADENIAKKDAQKSGKKVLSKHKKRKDASKTKKKGAKSLSTKKATGKEKTRKSKSSKRKAAASSHLPKTKSDKLLHHLKPQTKYRILEVNVDYIETFIGVELAFSLIWLLGSFELILFGYSAFPSVLISVAAFLSTFPAVIVLLRFKKPEHGIFAFSIGQLICGFIELYWIAVVWYDSVSYSSETRTATYCMQILVIYQFIATFFCNWRPYRKVNPKKFAKKCKNSVKEKLNGDKKKKSKKTKHQKNPDPSDESSLFSVDLDIMQL